MSLYLVGVEFDADISIPGKKPMRSFPPLLPAAPGWKGDWQGWRLRVTGDRVEIWSTPGHQLGPTSSAECSANGVSADQAVSVLSIPIHRCILRYAGVGEDLTTEAPSPKLAEALRGGEVAKPTESAAPKPAQPKPAPTKPKPPAPVANAPQPLRRPPGARTFAPAPISTEIEVPGNAPTKRAVAPLEASRAVGGEEP